MKDKVWAVITVMVTAITITINALANILPLNGVQTGELSDRIPNLFVPSSLTFAIWGIIYLLLISYSSYTIVIVRTENSPHQNIPSRLGPWYLVSGLANSVWIFAWHWQLLALSLVCMLIILVSLILVWQESRHGTLKSRKFSLATQLIRLPFSVYLGWITVATVANITAFLVDLGFDGGALAPYWTIAVLIAVGLIGLVHAWRERDLGYQAVLVWALGGIALKRLDFNIYPFIPEIAYTALAVAFVLILGVSLRILLTQKNKTT